MQIKKLMIVALLLGFSASSVSASDTGTVTAQPAATDTALIHASQREEKCCQAECECCAEALKALCAAACCSAQRKSYQGLGDGSSLAGSIMSLASVNSMQLERAMEMANRPC